MNSKQKTTEGKWRRGKDSNLRMVLPTTASKLAAALANGDLSVIVESDQFFSRGLGRKTFTVARARAGHRNFSNNLEILRIWELIFVTRWSMD